MVPRQNVQRLNVRRHKVLGQNVRRYKTPGGTKRPEVKSGHPKTFNHKLFKGLLHLILTIYSRPSLAHKATRKIARTFWTKKAHNIHPTCFLELKTSHAWKKPHPKQFYRQSYYFFTTFFLSSEHIKKATKIWLEPSGSINLILWGRVNVFAKILRVLKQLHLATGSLFLQIHDGFRARKWERRPFQNDMFKNVNCPKSWDQKVIRGLAFQQFENINLLPR
jgi:hypothetical protein